MSNSVNMKPALKMLAFVVRHEGGENNIYP